MIIVTYKGNTLCKGFYFKSGCDQFYQNLKSKGECEKGGWGGRISLLNWLVRFSKSQQPYYFPAMYNLEVGVLGRLKLREKRGNMVYFGKRFGIGKT